MVELVITQNSGSCAEYHELDSHCIFGMMVPPQASFWKHSAPPYSPAFALELRPNSHRIYRANARVSSRIHRLWWIRAQSWEPHSVHPDMHCLGRALQWYRMGEDGGKELIAGATRAQVRSWIIVRNKD